MQTLQTYFAEIVKSLSSLKERTPDVKLAAFFPLRGLHAKNELMVVGRAVNGWGKEQDHWTPMMASDEAGFQKILGRLLKSPSDSTECPLSWIANEPNNNDKDKSGLWGAGSYCKICNLSYRSRKGPCPKCQSETERVYSTAKSAFWRVIKSVTCELKVTSDPCWSSALIWSNLYKVAPSERGNPLAAQIRAQKEACMAMFQAEVEAWTPRRILFLTGYDWAEPFLNNLGIKKINRPSGLVSYFELIGIQNTRSSIVVAPHPQGKKEQLIIKEILAAFEQHKQG